LFFLLAKLVIMVVQTESPPRDHHADTSPLDFPLSESRIWGRAPEKREVAELVEEWAVARGGRRRSTGDVGGD
jgi:hypothetical protein